jgi:hypothetical protein
MCMSKITEQEKEVVAEQHRSHKNLANIPIWEIISEIMRDVPEAALSRLPADGAERHDDYLYGTHEKAPSGS